MPSVRELSRQLVVNPNTVSRAYRDLQMAGVLEPVRGTGLQVAGTRRPRLAARLRLDLVRGRLRDAIAEARRSNLPGEEIEAILRQEWARGGSNGTGQGETEATGGGR